MVVRVQLTVRHIRGHTFQVDADDESDVLGLKVQIWESQKIAIENQRLVFGGKELEDNLKLSDLNIGDNAVIFLIESNSEIPQSPQAEVPTKVVVQVLSVVSSINQIQDSSCNNDNSNQCSYRPSGESHYYEPFDEESVISEERMESAIALAYWVRRYCILGMLITAVCIYGSLYYLIPFFMYVLGIIGARKLNRCLLIFPLLLSTLLGFGLTVLTVYALIEYYYSFEFIYLFVGLLHIIIFFCICKLMCRIGKLTCQEWCQARLRIRARSCLC